LYPVDAVPADCIAAVDEAGRTLTYGDLATLAARFADEVQPRSLALVLTRNTVDFVQGCVGLINNGVVPMLLDVGTDPAVVARYIERYAPEYAFVPASIAHRFQGFRTQSTVGDYTMLVSRAPAGTPTHADLALLLPTSGSTGSPKLVRQSSANLRSNGLAIIDYLRITADERPITSLPMHYTYGYSIMNSHLLAGATLLLTERSVMEKAFWTFFRDQRATSFAGVPYTYQMLQRLRFARMDLPSLRTMTQAGGKMSPALVREFAEHALRSDIAFFVMYGQTEATARMSYVPPDRAVDKAGSIGVAIPGGAFFLVDEQGFFIDRPHCEGELGYRGPNVTMGYAEQRSDLGEGDCNGGELLTGDVAFRDDDGFYHITGRRNRYVKVFGKRVSLDDIEQMSTDHAGEAACLGVDDQVRIWITNDSVAGSLRRVLAERTAIHPSAFTVSVASELPRTAAGKVDYQRLQHTPCAALEQEQTR
jgi:long-chain acyl-CoA synthetase